MESLPMSTMGGENTNLEKARKFRDEGNHAMNVENYREALRLFHQCILLTRAVEQDSAVAIHQNSVIHVENPTIPEPPPTDDPEKQEATEEQRLVEERSRQKALNEDVKQEAHQIMAECYLNLANCVLNGGQRSAEDYLRVINYCNNVLSYEPNAEQTTSAILFKATAFMKNNYYNEAIEVLQELPEDEKAQKMMEECLQLRANQRRQREERIQANFAKQQQNHERNGFPPDRHGMNGNALNGTIN